jgi:hypothetical protein
MPFTSEKNRSDRPEFVFVGKHPGIDFANTLVISSGHLEDLLCSWSDVVDRLSRTGLSANPSLNVPASRGTEALKKVVELRPGKGQKVKTASAATAASPCCTTCSRSHSIGATFTSTVL